MSPIDDELRAALHGRAAVLAPSPDPLAGIERRARRMRRNRAATAVAGSVLAVAAIALAVPALSPEAAPRVSTPAASTPASPSPSEAPSPVPSPAAAPAQYDLAAPWAYRGGPTLDPQDLATYTRKWASTVGVSADEVVFTPLYGEIHEPSQRFRFVYAAYVKSSDMMEYGLAMSREAGPEFLSRAPLTRDTTAMPVPVPGDGEFLSLLVVAAPDTTGLEYAPNGADFRAMTAKAPGVGIDAVDGDGALDRVRVLGSDGSEVFSGPVPEFSDSGEAPVVGRPDNLLGWGVRGAQDAELVGRAVAGFAARKQVTRQQVEHQVLFVGDNDSGQTYVVLQGWVQGQRAQVFGWVETPGREAEGQLRQLTEPGTAAVAILLTGIPGRTTDELVVVPQPATGEVFYRAEPGADPQPVSTPGLDGVALIDRDQMPGEDSIVLLDGNGDLDRPTFDGPVSSLLCGEKTCS